MGDGRAEQGEHTVAGELLHGSLEPVDAGAQHPEQAVHGGVPDLGIGLLDEIHRPLDVGRQGRDELALAFHAGARGKALRREARRGRRQVHEVPRAVQSIASPGPKTTGFS